MPTINLREHYPDAHPEDFFVEVSEEVHQALAELKRKEDALIRQIYRYHAYHSLTTHTLLWSRVFSVHRRIHWMPWSSGIIFDISMTLFYLCPRNKLKDVTTITIWGCRCRI